MAKTIQSGTAGIKATEPSGRVVGLARRAARRAPMEEIDAGEITVEAGLCGDSRGAKYPKRRITILAVEDWQAAIAMIGRPDLPWTVRRANILVSGLRLPRAKGARLRIGSIDLEVTGQTSPCARMEEAAPGLLKALSADWRGGVTCAVLGSGPIALGAAIVIVSSPPERTVRLPG